MQYLQVIQFNTQNIKLFCVRYPFVLVSSILNWCAQAYILSHHRILLTTIIYMLKVNYIKLLNKRQRQN